MLRSGSDRQLKISYKMFPDKKYCRPLNTTNPMRAVRCRGYDLRPQLCLYSLDYEVKVEASEKFRMACHCVGSFARAPAGLASGAWGGDSVPRASFGTSPSYGPRFPRQRHIRGEDISPAHTGRCG